MKNRAIAIHLPQFYPFQENDEWWGKGFTEWRNTATSKPRFHNHYQPHIPADLGFYDLRLPEARMAQIELAKRFGIHGFCYYHYWFSGKQIMERPVKEMLFNPDEDFPFMLCWANEDWSRNWEGGFNKTLIAQNYSEHDDIEHFYNLLPYFKDPRYIRVNGSPVFCIYRTHLFPNIDSTIARWQNLATKEGFKLYICRFEDSLHYGTSYMSEHIDAAIEFQPFITRDHLKIGNFAQRMSRKLLRKEYFSFIYSYPDLVKKQLKRALNDCNYKKYHCVFPSWDNSPRRKGRSFTAFKNSSPELFEKWLNYVNENFTPYSEDENFIFINAWNEWAEGCHLEPDLKFGTRYLEAVKNVFKR
ncbi:MAG: glycoside hydrolase family 99-like domain-containing protein [Muribaculum sp.]|nr:glycoside hydrolase family 99-like domain-containing protein [Muribaculum sp.]